MLFSVCVTWCAFFFFILMNNVELSYFVAPVVLKNVMDSNLNFVFFTDCKVFCILCVLIFRL